MPVSFFPLNPNFLFWSNAPTSHSVLGHHTSLLVMAALLFKHALTLDSRHVVSSLRPGTSLHRFMSTLSDMDSTSNTDHSSPNPEQPKKKGRRKHRTNPSTPHHEVDPSKLGSLRNSSDPNLYRLFFRSPDKMRSLEDAQVFINHIKTNYGQLTQYQFSRVRMISHTPTPTRNGSNF